MLLKKVEKLELSFYWSFFLSFIIMLGSVAVGYSLTLPDPMLFKLQKDNVSVTEFQDGVFRSISSLVGCLGVFLFWQLIDHISFKQIVIVFLVYDIVVWFLFWKSFEFDFWAVIFTRSLSGVSMGAFCFIGPQYLSRLLIPENYVRHFKMFTVYGISLGIFLGQFLSLWLNNTGLIIFGCALSVFMLVLIIAFFRPETQEKERLSSSSSTSPENIVGSIWQRKYAKKILYTVGLMCFKQFSGVNTLIVNLTNILRYSNMPIPVEISASISSSGLLVGAVVNVLFMEFVWRPSKNSKPTLILSIWLVSIAGSMLTMVMGAKDSPSILPGCSSVYVEGDPIACKGPLSFGMLIDISLFFVVFTFGMWIITTAVVNGMFPPEMEAEAQYCSALFNCFFVFLVKLLSSFLINYKYRSFLAFWCWAAGSLVQGGLGLWVMRLNALEKSAAAAAAGTAAAGTAAGTASASATSVVVVVAGARTGAGAIANAAAEAAVETTPLIRG